jgi:Xaa-Pro dipeptidase
MDSARAQKVLKGKYPAKEHAKRVVEWMKKNHKGKGEVNGVLYLEGQKTRMIEDNDEAAPFR